METEVRFGARADAGYSLSSDSEAEFIGRLPVRVVCQPLSVDDLYLVLKTSEGSIILAAIREQSFAAYGIEVLAFEDEGLRRIAELAGEERRRARAD